MRKKLINRDRTPISKHSVKINVILNSIKSLMNIIFPLITFPYVTRVLMADNLGKVTYAQSIVSYFVLFAAMGINTYAAREGAKLRDCKNKLDKFSSEIFTTNLITTFLSYLLLIIFLIISKNVTDYIKLILLMSISIFFTTLGVDWINTIYEDYLVITIRSVIIQILNLLLLFMFVRSQNDYYVYAFLTVFTQIVTCFWNYFYVKKYVHIKITFNFNIKKHIKPMFIFFANNLAITIYCNIDTTMLGWIVSDYTVGIYAVAVKIYTIVKSLLASVYIVCIPRLSYYIGKKDNDNYQLLLNNIFSCLILILLPSLTGMIVLSKQIVFFLAGENFIDACMTLQILSFALCFAIFGGIITNCINIPFGYEKINLKATSIAAAINIFLNLFFIPLFKQNGAAFTTMIAECVVVIICILCNKKIMALFNIKIMLESFIHGGIGCIIIITTYFVLVHFININIILVLLTVLFSCAFYLFALLILKNRFIISIVKKALSK